MKNQYYKIKIYIENIITLIKMTIHNKRKFLIPNVHNHFIILLFYFIIWWFCNI